MKTAQIIRRFTFKEWGGTECVVWNTAKALRTMGDEPVVCATKALEPVPEERRDGVAIRRFDYFYPYFPLSKSRRLALDKKGGNPISPDLADALSDGNFDLLHCHNLGRLAAVARLAARARHIPYVMSFHGGCFDVPPEEMTEMLRPLRHTLRYGAVIDLLSGLRCDPLADASGLICVGRNELEPVRERYPDKLVEYLPNGVDVEHFRDFAGGGFREKFNIPAGRKLLLSVSRIDYQKNQLSLVELLWRLVAQGVDCHLALVGPATAGWYREKIELAAAEAGLADRVTFTGALEPDSPLLPAAYKAADLFVLPSRHEPFGIVILEAWSAGVPVVAAPVGGIKYLIRDGRNGFLASPDDGEHFAGVCLKLLADRASAAEVVRRAAAEAERDYSWRSVAARLRDFYKEVTDRFESD
ncbi:MAG: glycosyltransferase family 4 protein [Victivallaceae bacterium]|nr:glycosyltransferase family 4 protein [Victivallaceae bacterium]